MGHQFQFDIFLSHSSKDKPVVRELAARLKRDGVRVWLDEEHIPLLAGVGEVGRWPGEGCRSQIPNFPFAGLS